MLCLRSLKGVRLLALKDSQLLLRQLQQGGVRRGPRSALLLVVVLLLLHTPHTHHTHTCIHILVALLVSAGSEGSIEALLRLG